MKTVFLQALLLGLGVFLMGCVGVPASSNVSSHDLGGLLEPLNHQQARLRSLHVSAQAMAASTAMQYREASKPTQRSSYALNRWAASPAAMLDPALQRMLAPSGQGPCRLNISISEFIIDVARDGSARAVIAADLRLSANDKDAPFLTSIDVASPLAHTSPADGAQAMRHAAILLGKSIDVWLASDAGRACKA